MEFQLIIKKINNNLSSEEEVEFDNWYNESEDHQNFFHRVAQNYSEESLSIDKKGAWKKTFRRINKKPERRFQRMFAVAAVLTVAVISSFLIDFNNSSTNNNSPEVVETSTAPEYGKVILTLNNGENIPLVLDQNSRKIKNAEQRGSELIYSGPTDADSEETYNTLTVSKGEQFVIHLSDDTKVWLNADTKIKFPVDFKENTPRVIELVYGEAYFEVTTRKNSKDNFFVKTGTQTIEVIGTEFNVRSYLEDTTIETTLAEGRIDLIYGKEKRNRLEPGFKSIYSNKETLEVIPVNVENEISWRNGIFTFQDLELNEIMLTVSRWYDVKVIYNNPGMKQKKFNGVIRKSQDLTNVLTLLQKTGEVEYEYNNRVISIK